MRVYLKHDVWDGALERMRFIFREFEHVYLSFSGGKDSTVILELALIIAREMDRLPLKVLFLDQEAEWKVVIEYIRQVMDRGEVTPYWMQVPFRLFNAASTGAAEKDAWLHCWEEGKDSEWLRPKEPDSLHKNVYKRDRFKEMFEGQMLYEHPNEPCVHIAGVRCEESPGRAIGLANALAYKHITWGRAINRARGHYVLYPIYDWSYTDIWKSIHDNEWDYCKLYDLHYQYGISVREMRVSSVHHETSLRNLFFLQEFESETWERLTKRVSGVNTAGHLQSDFIGVPKTLPPMFRDWKEYRDYLLENLVTDLEIKEKFKAQFKGFDNKYNDEYTDRLMQVEIQCILANDYHQTKLNMFKILPKSRMNELPVEGKRQWVKY